MCNLYTRIGNGLILLVNNNATDRGSNLCLGSCEECYRHKHGNRRRKFAYHRIGF